MDIDLATRVDRWLADQLHPADDALINAAAASADAGLPDIAVSPALGSFLQIITAAVAAQRVLEIGTLGGYSTIYFARAVPPDGTVCSLEVDPKHAEVARRNVDRAGVGDRVDIRVGPALETLPTLAARSFDLAFIDADKINSPAYLRESMRLVRAGGLIIADNVVRAGQVLDEASDDPSVVGVRQMIADAADTPGLETAALQIVGIKGHDGLLIARVGADAS